ncbi:MAG: hypothetical protein IPH32_19060 [Bacteroidetes bacterium]|nr:hypothetical protein [Bacteroidota bacterium]
MKQLLKFTSTHFRKENVTKEVQDKLFFEWKNGGEYEFPEFAIHWEVDANNDTVLPENVKLTDQKLYYSRNINGARN